MSVGEYIRKIRIERGYSLRDLASKAGTSPAEISRIESGKRMKPSPTILQSLSKALLIDQNYLLQLAGYITETVHQNKSAPYTILDPGDKARSIYDCAEDMYKVDKDWLQTAYMISRTLSQEERDLIRNTAKTQMEHFSRIKNSKIRG